jgi:hypothetical protein
MEIAVLSIGVCIAAISGYVPLWLSTPLWLSMAAYGIELFAISIYDQNLGLLMLC